MRDLTNKLQKRSIDYKRLIEYGFVRKEDSYEYKTKICDGQFEMIVNISDQNKTSKIIDLGIEEEYVLVDISESTGEFVGKIRDKYENRLQEIIDKCTKKEVFKSNQTKDIIEYVKNKYNDELEFLWEKFDDNAIWRNKENNKWYGIIMTISKKKLGIDSEEKVEVIDLLYNRDKIQEKIDNKTIYPGYHMNKKSWITIILDNSVENREIYKLIDNSYKISSGNKK